jgi:CDP-4-dehydro-6-deoxyglucose reductase
MAFDIVNQKNGKSFEAKDSETLLSAALRQSHLYAYSCRSGRCGSCKAKLISGLVNPGTFSETALTSVEKDSGMILLCQSAAQSNLTIEIEEIAGGEAIEIRTMPCRVTALNKLNHDVIQLHLRLPPSETFVYIAGQYIDILLADGRRRSFSVANRPELNNPLELHIRHVPDGYFTHQVFGSLAVNDLLRFQGPYGTFFLRDSPNLPAVLVAGGTGLGPIKAILEEAFYENVEREFHLFWGARARRDLYLHDKLGQWATEHANLTYTPVLSEPLTNDKWPGEMGWVHESVLNTFTDLSEVEVYASGPPPMIEASYTAFINHGLPTQRFFFDSFEFALDDIE